MYVTVVNVSFFLTKPRVIPCFINYVSQYNYNMPFQSLNLLQILKVRRIPLSSFVFIFKDRGVESHSLQFLKEIPLESHNRD